MRTAIRLIVLLGATAMLCSACGYKGSLYFPEAEPAVNKVSTQPSDVLKNKTSLLFKE